MTALFVGRGQAALLVLAFLTAGAARADIFHFSGTLDPAANPHLTFWDQLANAYAAPVTGSAADMAYNIAVYTFSQSLPGPVSFASNGYGLSGFDSVLSVFEGTGDSALYVHHEYSLLGPGDFSFPLNLGSGYFTVAVTMFGSQPCGAGLCAGSTGTFGDGFNNLVNFDPFAPAPLFFDVRVVTESSPVPEPGSLGLLLVAIAGVLARNRFRALLHHS